MPDKKKRTQIPDPDDLRLFLRVRFLKFFFLPFLFLFNGLWINAQELPQRRGSQVIDDTTRQVYGPNTSRYYSESEVFYNLPVLHAIDTFPRNFHRNSSYVQKYDNLYQDLGNIGTAMRPVFFRSPENMGVRSGFNSYDLYSINPKLFALL